jgi:hypothetical protein
MMWDGSRHVGGEAQVEFMAHGARQMGDFTFALPDRLFCYGSL